MVIQLHQVGLGEQVRGDLRRVVRRAQVHVEYLEAGGQADIDQHIGLGYQRGEVGIVLNIVLGYGLHYLIHSLVGIVHVGFYYAREGALAVLHVGGTQALGGDKIEYLTTWLIVAHLADESHRLAQLVQVHRHVERSAARLLARGQNILQHFAEADSRLIHKKLFVAAKNTHHYQDGRLPDK